MWGCIKVASRFGFGAAGCRFLAPLVVSLLPTGALADQEVPRIEFFTGFEASDNYTSAYVGGGYAFGKGFHQESLAPPGGRQPRSLSLRRQPEIRRSLGADPV
jgi:hypothetical protein